MIGRCWTKCLQCNTALVFSSSPFCVLIIHVSSILTFIIGATTQFCVLQDQVMAETRNQSICSYCFRRPDGPMAIFLKTDRDLGSEESGGRKGKVQGEGTTTAGGF